jgi:hypothetical protein
MRCGMFFIANHSNRRHVLLSLTCVLASCKQSASTLVQCFEVSSFDVVGIISFEYWRPRLVSSCFPTIPISVEVLIDFDFLSRRETTILMLYPYTPERKVASLSPCMLELSYCCFLRFLFWSFSFFRFVPFGITDGH